MKIRVAQTMRMQAQNDKSVQKLLSALKKAEIGIIYHYYGDSGSVMDVVIEASDL